MQTTYDPEYSSNNSSSTYGLLWHTRQSADLPIVDVRPWYRRWWFGLLKWDGEWQFGLGPVAIRWPFVKA